MKILLMNPPMKEKELFTKSSKETASRIPPLGLAYLGAYLEKQGHEVMIWDGFVERDSWEEIKKKAEKYDLLGIHVLTSFALRSYQFAKFLKEKLPNKPIVLGGCHVSALPIEAITNPFIDYVVVGEGEITLAELCWVLENKKYKIKDVLGVYYKDKKNTIRFNGQRPLIKNFQS